MSTTPTPGLQSSTSTQKPKIELPNKELVGVTPTKKKEINENLEQPLLLIYCKGRERPKWTLLYCVILCF